MHLIKNPIQLTWPNHNKPDGIHHRRSEKERISSCHEWKNANLTVASRGISNESVSAKFTRNRYIFHQFSVSSARPEIFLCGSYWDPTPESGVPWDYHKIKAWWLTIIQIWRKYYNFQFLILSSQIIYDHMKIIQYQHSFIYLFIYQSIYLIHNISPVSLCSVKACHLIKLPPVNLSPEVFF